jgi:hypothetical protein
MVGPSSLHVDVDASPVYELLLQVETFSQRHRLHTFEVGHRWGVTQQGRCSPRMLRAFERLGRWNALWDQFVGLQAVEHAPSVAAFLGMLASMDATEIHRHMVGYYSESLSADERVARLQPLGQDRMAEAVKELVLDVLSGWYQRIFARDEAAIAGLLDDEAQARRMLSVTDPTRLILVTTGVRYMGSPGVRRVLLIPSLIIRPWLGVVSYRSLHIYCYPVLEDPGAIETAVPPFLLRLYGALATPGCLQILKALGSERLTVPEIADRVAEKPELVRAHLARLRISRLVQITCDGAGDTVYERRTELMRAVGQPLRSYLHLPALPLPADRESSTPAQSLTSD